ncbi:MAG TPA: transglycosylase SLT domain-containing protein [Thermoanaerobaculia bacterium]|nr:transglycosylase SLT domain-containing protein [Thermoanaerobaculia bacterium]
MSKVFRAALLGIVALLPACAGTATVPRVTPPSSAPASSSASSDAIDYRKALEEAHERLVKKQAGNPSEVIAEASQSSSMPVPEQESIAGALRLFSTRLKPSIQTSLNRSARFRSRIDEILREYRLPAALAYLPVIESAFVPTLTSRAGAHGIWQFMEATAREYGLRVDWWVDERADPEKSTLAAARYLRDLHRQFGDWPLALAAYNAGPGRIRRAMSQTGATTFWELSDMVAIPKETRGYVPTFYATVLITSDPPAHGFKLTEPEASQESQVRITGPVSLGFLAESAGLDEKTLQQLNPQLRRGLVPPGNIIIRVPAGAAGRFGSLGASIRDEDPSIRISSFTLRGGDSLESLADLLDLPVKDIVDINKPLSTRPAREGDSVYLPLRREELTTRLRGLTGHAAQYEVAGGDTLYSIATRHGMSVEELREANGLSSEAVIRPGDRLILPSSVSVQTGM